MYSFLNDYSESAHPNILKAIETINYEQNNSYGLDHHSTNARELIQEVLENYSVDIHFITGGTLTNLTFLSYALRPYEAVISADTAHINTHETGAIEASGHKVVDIHTVDGKLTPALIQPILEQHENEHWVDPKLVYISNPTELGTVYTKSELESLRRYCLKHNLLLYLDGARLPMALAVEECNLSIQDLPELTDAFYIGGTKVGALFGEALVLVNDSLKDKFRFNMKQRGALAAKGWLLGIQFEELMKNGLYFELGKHSNDMASLLRNAFADQGFSFLADSPTNQIFPILPNCLVEKINQHYMTTFQCKVDEDHTCIRFCTSWASKKDDILAFIEDFNNMQA